MGSGDGLVIHSHNSHDRCRVWRWMKWEEGRSATAWEWNFTLAGNEFFVDQVSQQDRDPAQFWRFFEKLEDLQVWSHIFTVHLYTIYIIYIIIHTHVLRTDFGAKEFFGCLKIQGNDLEDFEVSPKESTRWPDMAPQNNRRIRHGSSLGVPMGPRIAGPV